MVYSLGTVFTEELAAALLEEVHGTEPEKETLALPECCELAVREKNGIKYYFVLNYSGECAAVGIKRPLFSLFDGKRADNEILLEPYGAAVFKNV